MNLLEIINRDESVPITQDEALYVIKEYVKIRKGVDIKPIINFFSPFSEIKLMNLMLIDAKSWLKLNPKEIKL